MKILKVAFLFCAILVCLTSKAKINLSAIVIKPKADSVSKVEVTKKESIKVLQMQMFSKMTLADYEKLSGKKLNKFRKLSFKLTQHRVNTMLKHYQYGDGPTTLQKISWLLKGILLGPIALLIGYLFLKDEERELIKWIWFGFAGWTIILGIILLA